MSPTHDENHHSFGWSPKGDFYCELNKVHGGPDPVRSWLKAEAEAAVAEPAPSRKLLITSSHRERIHGRRCDKRNDAAPKQRLDAVGVPNGRVPKPNDRAKPTRRQAK